MSWTTTPSSSISVSGWNYNYNSFRTTPTTTAARFALHDSGNNTLGNTHDIEFRIENGNLILDVNPSTSGVSANPNAFTHQPPLGALSAQVSSAQVNVGDTIKLYTSIGGAYNGSFVVSSEFNITQSGPTVTSITADKIFVPSDTVTNTDFTLLKNGSAYANTNISLTGPGPQPPSDARGYTYSLTYNGTALYSRTIDSKSFHDLEYDDSWTSSPTSSRSTNSSRILAVLGTLPTTANFTVPTVVGQTIGTRTFHDLNRSMRVILTYPAGSTQTQFICYFHVSEINNEIKGKFQSHTLGVFVFDESPFFTIGAQQTMSHTFTINNSNITISVNDWVYSDEPEGDGYVAPVTTTSDGGGKQRRYPIISTNLFDRQRSIYSIGNTHKDETLF